MSADDEVSDDELVELPSRRNVDGPATQSEVCGWYMFDFANSPYWQVYVTALMPIALLWLAEGYAAGGIQHEKEFLDLDVDGNRTVHKLSALTMPGLGITAGSYPSLVMWTTLVFQTLVLLSFSAFGDYGNRRKQLLVICTYVSCFFVFLNIACSFSFNTWWVAGVLRILAGIFFALSAVYYNAYLPVLAEQHEDAVGLKGDEFAEKVIALSDDMSNKGQLLGYGGGLIMLIVSWAILYSLECDNTNNECSPVDLLLPINVCIALVALWWAGWSVWSFVVLKPRPGPPFPEDANVLCLGWSGICETFCKLRSYPETARFLMSFFLYSDGVNTLTSVSVLVLEDDGGASASTVLFLAILAVVGALVGGFAFLGVQKCTGIAAKRLILSQLAVYSVCCVAAVSGGLTYSSWSYYLVMAPMMLSIGSLQAYGRAIFSTLIPTGSEASMFAFFAITDRGSNLIGAGVTFVVHNIWKTYIPVFGYLLFAFAVSAAILCCVDVEKGVAEAQGGGIEDLDEEEEEEEDEEL